VSHMVLGKEAKEGDTINGYKKLIQHIMDCTNMQIALIPHVVWNSNDDREPLRELYEEFKDTGRVIMIEDTDCKKLKGYISRCRIFVGARTHSTIAAYSSCVPTLVIGYSVKSRGIATDIFGTDERFVLPVQTISKPQQLVDSFDYMLLHEHSVKEHLKLVMPEYIETARKNAAGL
ncbi:MAG: polysaccharide pyruvyl transferase family protein, partial [Butyrivibrio sp.]|nr:polysaccharide pyruvyl transferase family protein [Butyrivibrio sp.]